MCLIQKECESQVEGLQCMKQSKENDEYGVNINTYLMNKIVIICSQRLYRRKENQVKDSNNARNEVTIQEQKCQDEGR